MPEAEGKPRSDARLKLLPEDQQERIWRWLTEDKKSLEETAVLCFDDLNVRTSRTAVGEFFKWYRLQLRMRDRESRVEQIVNDLQKAGANLSADQVQQYGAALFMSEAIESADGEGFVAAARLHLQSKELAAKVEGFKATYAQKERQLELDKEKFKASLRTKLEAGLAALMDEIKGSPRALEIFQKLQAEVKEAEA